MVNFKGFVSNISDLKVNSNDKEICEKKTTSKPSGKWKCCQFNHNNLLVILGLLIVIRSFLVNNNGLIGKSQNLVKIIDILVNFVDNMVNISDLQISYPCVSLFLKQGVSLFLKWRA